MSFHIESVPGAIVATLNQTRVLGDAVVEFRDELCNHSSETKPLILDLSPVDYIDSSGLSVLVSLVGEFGDGKVHLCGVRRTVEDVIRLTRLEELFKIHRTRDDALRAVAQPV